MRPIMAKSLMRGMEKMPLWIILKILIKVKKCTEMLPNAVNQIDISSQVAMKISLNEL